MEMPHAHQQVAPAPPQTAVAPLQVMQPDMSVAVAVGEAQSMPQSIAQPVPVPQEVQFTLGEGYTPTRPARVWTNNLFDFCPSGFEGMCLAAYCCTWVTAPQLYEKVLSKKGACIMIAPVLLILYVVRAVTEMHMRFNPFQFTDEDGGLNVEFLVAISSYTIATLIQIYFTALLLAAVRKRIRDKDQIATASCGEAEDCCCAFWCQCCINVQIFHHLDMRSETYQLCSAEGTPTVYTLQGRPPEV